MTVLGGEMTKAKSWEVTDDFWSRVQPLIPVRQSNLTGAKLVVGANPKTRDWFLKPSFMCCARGVNGKPYPPSVLAVPAPCTPDFLNGRGSVYFRRCGNSVWPNTTNVKASPGDGRALMAR